MRAVEKGRPLGRAARLGVVIALAGALVISAAGPAYADPVPPPGWQGTAPGSWVTFELSSYTPAAGASVDLVRSSNLSGDALLAAFGNWGAPQTPGGPAGWPETFSASGVTLSRATWCEYTAGSCAYTITSGDGSEFWVAVATDDPPGSGQYPIDLATTPHGTVDVQDPPPPPPPADPVVVANVTFASGTATFDARGSSGPGGSTPAGYQWTLAGGQQGTQQFTCDAPVCSPPANITLDPGATYDVTLDLLDANGVAMASSPGVAQLPIPNAPPPPQDGGGGGGGGGGAPAVGSPPANAPANAPIAFANPVRRAPASLGGGSGAASAPTIVWLWRPEWFAPTIDAELPRTSGRPEVKGSAEIVVSTAGPDGASAGPWLVGLGAFGLLGGGYLFNRFRRVRLLEI